MSVLNKKSYFELSLSWCFNFARSASCGETPRLQSTEFRQESKVTLAVFCYLGTADADAANFQVNNNVIALTTQNVVRSVPFVRLQLKKLWTDLYQTFTIDRLWESTV